MATINFNDLKTYTGKALTYLDWNTNFQKVITWLTGNTGTYYDISVNSVTVQDDIAKTALTAWTPTVTSAGTAPTYSTVSAYYKQLGKMTYVNIKLVNTSGGTAGAGANIIIIGNLPAALNNAMYNINGMPLLNGQYRNNASYAQGLIGAYASATTIRLYKGTIQAGNEFTCANQDHTDNRVVYVEGWYESV